MNRIALGLIVLCSLAGPVAASSGGWVIDGVSTSTGAVSMVFGTNSVAAYRGDWGVGVSNLASGAVQPNHTGDVNVSGSVAARRLVAPGVYDESGRSVAGIAVDSAVRYDVGVEWELIEAMPPGVWFSMAWSPKLRLFVTVTSAKVAYSPDGINWTEVALPLSYARGICWAEELGLFVVVTDSSRGVALSADGVNWALAATTPSGNMRGVTWSPELGMFVAVGANRIYTSTDGQGWTLKSAADSLWIDVVWAPELGLFVASSSGNGPRIAVSADGENWTYPTVPDNYWLSVDWSPELGLLVATGSRGGAYSPVIVSANGLSWTEIPTAPNWSWGGVRWSSEARCFVAVSSAGKAMRSTDGYNWTLQPVPTPNALNAVEWSPTLRMFVATGGAGVLSVVDDSVTVGSLTVGGAISATGDMSVGGNVQMGTAYGTNTISGDTQIGNSERRLDINQNGMFIMDAVTEDISFAVEQYEPSQWRVDLKGNPLINAGDIAAAGTITGGVDVQAGSASLTNAFQRSGDTMTGMLGMGTNIVSGQRFGEDAGNNAVGTGWHASGRQAGVNADGDWWHAFGNYAGLNSTGRLWHANGYFAGINAQGDFWHASGYGAGNGAVHTNSAAFGIQAGYLASGNNRLYLDVYPSIPVSHQLGGATNDAVFIDNGYLYLGRGAGNHFGGALGGTLRGDWKADGNVEVASITLGGETRSQWNAQSENGPAFFFGNGDYLYADGQNLFYVSQDGVTNQVSLSGP